MPPKKVSKKKVSLAVHATPLILPTKDHPKKVLDAHRWSDGKSAHSYCLDCTHWRHTKGLSPVCKK